MRYRILGTMQARAGGRAVDLGGPRQRRVLAALLMSPNRTVPLARLVEAAWDADPPATAARQVRNRVSALRATLTRHGGFIDTTGDGYRLRVGDGELDLAEFDDLVAHGRATGDPDVLRRALAMWRGPALDGVDGQVAARHAALLTERRLAALETCLGLELAAGRHADVTPELRELVGAHPRHEGFAAQLVAALARAGRHGEARAVYAETAARLADELGVDPGAALRRAHAEATAEATADGPAPVRPAQLPTDVAGFTGRADHLTTLDDLVGAPTVLISAIGGTAGVGKTALAVHWAHRVRADFADGQLYLNLQGYSKTPPVRPLDALGALLRGLGLHADQVPSTVEDAAARYRSLLAGRRVLVVLDNAADADQVRPLLPGSPGSLALITSRDALAGLAGGCRRIALDVLSPDEAHALLTRLLGADRVTAEPDAARDLARLCAYLPLALRIAAANLDDTATLADHTRALAAGNRLGALQIDGDERAAVRGAFDLSYAALPVPARRMFRLLGLPAAADISVSAAASLLGVTRAEAASLLDQLAAAHLIDRSAADHYTFHDLLRAYAAELAEAEDSEADRRVAVGRIIEHYLRTARAAGDLISPLDRSADAQPAVAGVTVDEPADQAGAFSWFATERAALLATVDQATRGRYDTHAYLLTQAFSTYLSRVSLRHDKLAVWQAALTATRRLEDLGLQALAHRNLGVAYGELGDFDTGRRELDRALELYPGLDEPLGHARAHHALSWLLHQQARPREALEHARRSLPLYRSADDRDGEASALNAIGWFLAHLGDMSEALTYCEQALALHRETDQLVGQAATLDSIALIHHRLGQYPTAVTRYADAVTIWRNLGDRFQEAEALCCLGDTHVSADDPEAARTAWTAAKVIFTELEHPHLRRALDRLDGLSMDMVNSGSRSDTTPA